MTEAVFAQMPTPSVHFNEDQGKRSRTKEQQEYDKALDRAYQSATKKFLSKTNRIPGAISVPLVLQ